MARNASGLSFAAILTTSISLFILQLILFFLAFLCSIRESRRLIRFLSRSAHSLMQTARRFSTRDSLDVFVVRRWKNYCFSIYIYLSDMADAATSLARVDRFFPTVAWIAYYGGMRSSTLRAHTHAQRRNPDFYGMPISPKSFASAAQPL